MLGSYIPPVFKTTGNSPPHTIMFDPVQTNECLIREDGAFRGNHFESFLYLISKLKNSVSQGLSGLLDRLPKPCVKVRRFR